MLPLPQKHLKKKSLKMRFQKDFNKYYFLVFIYSHYFFNFLCMYAYGCLWGPKEGGCPSLELELQAVMSCLSPTWVLGTELLWKAARALNCCTISPALAFSSLSCTDVILLLSPSTTSRQFSLRHGHFSQVC